MKSTLGSQSGGLEICFLGLYKFSVILFVVLLQTAWFVFIYIYRFFFSYHVSQHAHPEVLCRADGHLISYIGSNFGKSLFDFRNSCSVKSKINSLYGIYFIKSFIGYQNNQGLCPKGLVLMSLWREISVYQLDKKCYGLARIRVESCCSQGWTDWVLLKGANLVIAQGGNKKFEGLPSR